MLAGHANESDGFAIAMIAVMICSFGVIALILFTILRNGAKRNLDVEELMDDFEREEKARKLKKKKPAVAKKVEAEPWERDGDWWKK